MGTMRSDFKLENLDCATLDFDWVDDHVPPRGRGCHSLSATQLKNHPCGRLVHLVADGCRPKNRLSGLGGPSAGCCGLVRSYPEFPDI